MRFTSTSSLACLVAAVLAACAADSECEGGYDLVGDLCLMHTPDSGSSGVPSDAATAPDATRTTDSGDPARDEDAGQVPGTSDCEPGPGGDDDGFGGTCIDATSHRDCTCEADFCAIQPGTTEGFCTREGCGDDPGICPDGWSCFDLRSVGGPSFCVKP